MFLNLAAEEHEEQARVKKEEDAKENKKEEEDDNMTLEDGGFSLKKGVEFNDFEEFSCTISRPRQVYAIIVSIVLQTFRNPLAFVNFVFWPVTMTIISVRSSRYIV